jgi:hypothetical protein
LFVLRGSARQAEGGKKDDQDSIDDGFQRRETFFPDADAAALYAAGR